MLNGKNGTCLSFDLIDEIRRIENQKDYEGAIGVLDLKLQLRRRGEEHTPPPAQDLVRIVMNPRLKYLLVGVRTGHEILDCYKHLWEKRRNMPQFAREEAPQVPF